MPTINQLPVATASATTDAFICSQGGIDRQATLEQMLASAQPLLALQPGQLLGRFSSGAGGVETISVGPNLTLNSGTLSSPAAFLVAGLASAATPGATDIVPIGQAGQNVGANYAQFMSGLANLSGITGGNLVAQASVATTSRSLSMLFDNAVSAEDFGAAGDGVTDDTAALAAALSSGQPVRLGPKTYCTTGQWTIIGAEATLIGVPGQTTIRRLQQSSGGAWISIQSNVFHADGIIFDANTALNANVWSVLVTPACTISDFHRCVFANAQGPTLGCGITFQAADPEATQHALRSCETYGNALHGVWVQALQTVRIDGCRAHGNGTYGICIDYTDPALIQKLHYCQVVNCTAWNNQRGISIGNYNATNTTPPVWGNANPDAVSILVCGNICHDNTIYGIAVAGQSLNIVNNILANNGAPAGAGLLANVSYSRITGNVITGASQFGIDVGGSIFAEVSANHVSNAVHGINCGGGQSVRVASNMILGCTGWSVLVNNVETDGEGNNFGLACDQLAITDNWIGFAIAEGGGAILLADNPQNVLVARNSVVGSGAATIGQALWPNTNSVVIRDNQWNMSPEASLAGTINGTTNQLIYPDLLDILLVSAATSPIGSVLSMRQQALGGQIGFIAVTEAGTNYTSATVAISGDGEGATAIAYISGGAVIGVALTNGGSNYTTATVTISGNGNGAVATAQISLPVLISRRLTLLCDESTIFSGPTESSPILNNWTGYSFTVPAQSSLTLSGQSSGWSADGIALADYLVPNGTGGMTVTSLNNQDVAVQTNGSGSLRITTSAEPIGVTTTIGRGSPEGVVTATAGSDYRNLNGGVGSTYWIKQTNEADSGWIAVA